MIILLILITYLLRVHGYWLRKYVHQDYKLLRACVKHFYPLLVTEHSILNLVRRNFSGLPKNTNHNTGYYSSNDRPAKTTNLLEKVNKQFVKTCMTEEEMDIKEHCKLFWNVSHLLPLTPGGGGGWYFGKFWVGMCHWDPGTLSLYQSKFSWIFAALY